jgi:hypothetical protein
MEVAGTAIGFWEYQKTQEVSWSQHQLRCDSGVKVV